MSVSTTLTTDERNALRELILEEIRFHKHRSFQQLLSKANRQHGFRANDYSTVYHRAIDGALQALRRQGVIEWFRFGTYKMWKLKDA